MSRIPHVIRASRRVSRFAVSTLLLMLASGAPSVGSEAPATPPVAEVNGDAITAEDLERALGAKLRQLEEQIYDLKRQQLDALIAERLLAQEAARRGTSVAAFLDAEVTAKVGLVTEQEVEAFYQANKARLRGEEAAVRAAGPDLLAAAEARRAAGPVRGGAPVAGQDRGPAPGRPRSSGSRCLSTGRQSAGPTDAPVTLVEFSDFHCPFCKQVQATLTQLLERYPAR